MNRIRYNNQFNIIREAVGLLPIKILPMLENVGFVFDYNPFYLGFNPPPQTDDGRSYLDICHCVYSWDAPDRKITIFLLSKNLKLYDNPLNIIWHEIGHSIHEQLDFYDDDWLPFWDYEEDWCECFAGSFVRWLYSDRNMDDWDGNQEMQRKLDKRPIEFFNELFGLRT